jgi:signal transduction histidine kinase
MVWVPDAGDGRDPVTTRVGFGAGDLVLLRTIESLRWAGLVPMLLAVWLRRETLDRGYVAFVVVAAAVLYSLWIAAALSRRDPRLLSPSVAIIGVAVGAALMAADGWVFGWQATFDPPALGAIWVLAAVLHAGVAMGSIAGALAGLAVALARLGGATAPHIVHEPSLSDILQQDPPRLLPTLSLVALYSIVGLGAGYLARLQRRAEEQISAAKARDEVARTLHDGVLQTLAMFQRRAGDPELVELARQTDADLRAYLTTDPERRGTLDAELRTVCTTFARHHGLTPQLLVDDLPKVPATAVAALAGATTEALANVAKHAKASRVTVYAGQPEDRPGIVVTVHDDGTGFDTRTLPSDRGFAQSIEARLHEVGGTATVRSMNGHGTEVTLWVP